MLALVARRQSIAGRTHNDSGDELERILNHGVTPQQDGLRKLLFPARSRTNVTDRSGCKQANSSIQKHRPFLRRRQAAGFVFAEQAISQPGDDAITKIPNRQGDHPQQPAEYLPATAQSHQNATHRAGSSKNFPLPHKHQRVQIASNFFTEQFRCGRSLQRRETQFVLRIVCQQPVHGVIAKPADSVEENDRMTVSGAANWFCATRDFFIDCWQDTLTNRRPGLISNRRCLLA